MARASSRVEADLIASMREAVAYAKGARRGYRAHTFSPDDVRLIRARTKKSQSEFARTFGISVKTLQKWERGEAHPTGAAATLLKVIRQNPGAVARALKAA